ncbi:FkbM family methyltransferase [Nitrobacteraceae bacterium AZCC 1564]
MHLKPVVRYLYSVVPGLAASRFAVMDMTAAWAAKPEYAGTSWFSIGDGLIIDVGANRGQSTAAFKSQAPKARIFAFEPEPRSAARLSERFRDDAFVTVQDCALGAQSGTITFFVPSYGRWECDGMAATDRATATDWLKDPGRMLRFDENKVDVKEYAVACKTLDSYNLSPSLIKLHAQGAELDILKGSIETIRRSRPALMCAFATNAFTELAAQFGYLPYIYKNETFFPGIAQRPVTFTWYLSDHHRPLTPIKST